MKYIPWIFLVLIVIFRIFLYYNSRITYPDGTKIRITGRVTTEPIRYPTSQYIRLLGYKVYLPSYPQVSYGDSIIVEGIVEGDRLQKPALVHLEENKGFLTTLRKSLLSFYEKSLPHPHSALIAGMTIGSKAGLGEEFWEILKNTGTAHIVVASGMNVTLIAKFLITSLILFISRKKALLLAFFGVWTYAFLSGFDAPIIRAAIMGSLTFGAQELGRLYYAWRALLVSALAMLFIKPEWILDLGFLLSFTATASLMLFERKVYRLIRFVPNIIREDFSTSLAAQVGVAPLLFIYFGQFNALAPLINAIILWTVVPVTIIGLVGGFLGFIFEPLGRAVLVLAYPLTSWFVFIVSSFQIPFSN